MPTRPDKLPRWATEDVIDAQTGYNNVVEPPEEKKDIGWVPFEAGARNFHNWLFRKTYEWLLYVSETKKVTDGDGVEAVNQENVSFKFYAIDTTNTDNYVTGFGYRATGAPAYVVSDNNVLNVGTPTAAGNFPITGGTAGDVQLVVEMD